MHMRWVNYSKRRVDITCPCGTVFSVVESKQARKHCSKSCSGKAQKGKRGPLSDKQKAQISKAQKARYKANPESNPFYGRTPTNYTGWGKGGFCEELGFHVRSTWERDYLTALKKAGITFEYEPKRFDLGEGRGTYLPDIRLEGKDVYVEITGWDKPGKAEKRELFKSVYGFPLYVESRRPTPQTIEDFVSMCKEVSRSDD